MEHTLRTSIFCRLSLVCAFAVLTAVGCTKKEEVSQIQFKAPDWSALAKNSKSESSALNAGTVPTITRVMINLSGPDMQTIVLPPWTLRDTGYQSGNPPKPPEVFTFENVKRGSNRLIQVLAIVEDIDTTGTNGGDGPMTFYYGDTTKTLSRDFEDVPIQLANQGVMGADQSSVSGRYLDASGKGITGKLNMYYAPPGRPEMIVDTSMMFSGFFDISLPTTVPFSYRLAGGQTLFDRITIGSLDNQLGPQLMRVQVPNGFNQEDGERRARNGRTRVIGFVGPGATGKKMCFNSTTESIQGLYTSAAAGSSSTVNWNPTSNSALDARVLGGGTALVAGACPGGTEIGTDYLSLTTQALAYGDSPVGIRGPFREIPSAYGNYISASLSGTDLTLSWKYLAATIGDGVDGVGVFTKVLSATDHVNDRWRESAPCTELVSKHGFKEVTRVAAGTRAAPIETYTIADVNSAAYSAGKHVTLLCPYSNAKGYHDFALVNDSKYNYGGVGGGQMQTATKLVAQRAGSANIYPAAAARTNVNQGTCTQVSVRMTDAAGNLGYRMGASGPLQASGTISGTGAQLYYDNQCMSGGTSTQTASYNGDSFNFWVKVDNTSSQFDIVITDTTTGGAAITPVTFLGSRTGPLTPVEIKTIAPSSIWAHECFQVTYVSGLTQGNEFMPASGVSDSISYSSISTVTSNLSFHFDSTCGSSKSSDSIYSSMSTVSVWAKYTGNLTSINLAPVGTTLSPLPAMITVNQPGTAAAFEFSLPPTANAESCMPFRVRSVDANKRGSPALDNVGSDPVITFTYNGSPTPPANGGVYSDYECTMPVSSLTFLTGYLQSGMYYFRWPSQGAVTLGGTSTNTQTVSTMNLTMNPASLGMLVLTIPEVTWSFAGGYSGYGPQKVADSAGLYHVTIRAVTPLGNPIAGFAEANVNDLGITDQYGMPAVCGNLSSWANGVATADCYMPDHMYGAAYRAQLRAGGGMTPYPAYYSTYPQFMIVDPAESPNGTTHFLSRPSSYYTNTCQPVMVQRRYVTTISTPAAALYNIPLTTNSNVSAFYPDQTCSGGTISSAAIQPGHSEKVVYMKMTGAGQPDPLADGVQLTDPYTYSPPTGIFAAPGTATSYTLNAQRITVKGACEPIMVVRTDSNGAAIVAPSTVNLTVTQSSMNATFYTTPDCSGGSANVFAWNSGESAKVIYYRPMIDGNGQIDVIDDAGTPLSGVMGGITVYP